MNDPLKQCPLRLTYTHVLDTCYNDIHNELFSCWVQSIPRGSRNAHAPKNFNSRDRVHRVAQSAVWHLAHVNSFNALYTQHSFVSGICHRLPAVTTYFVICVQLDPYAALFREPTFGTPIKTFTAHINQCA